MNTMLKHDEIKINTESRILFPGTLYESVIEHCKRKLSQNYLEGESQERKAFGLLQVERAAQIILLKDAFRC